MSNIYDSVVTFTGPPPGFSCPEGESLNAACAQTALDAMNAAATTAREKASEDYDEAETTASDAVDASNVLYDTCMLGGDAFDVLWPCLTAAHDREEVISADLLTAKKGIRDQFGSDMAAARTAYVAALNDCCE